MKKKERQITHNPNPPLISREDIKTAVKEVVEKNYKSHGLKDIIYRSKDDFRIPISFKVGGKTYKVEFHDDLAEHQGKHGESWVSRGTIKLQSRSNGQSLTQDYINETFCHELIHIMLNEAGRDDLSGDEKLVTPCGMILYQILKTMVYDEGKLA